MFPELKNNQDVFIEITNPIYGGTGWKFKTYLWSPHRSRNNNNT
jgi:hypothetical protein